MNLSAADAMLRCPWCTSARPDVVGAHLAGAAL
jgi:hypothetical protein